VTFNRRAEVLVPDVYRGFKESFLGRSFEPFKVCWLDCSLKFSISENKAFKCFNKAFNRAKLVSINQAT